MFNILKVWFKLYCQETFLKHVLLYEINSKKKKEKVELLTLSDQSYFLALVNKTCRWFGCWRGVLDCFIYRLTTCAHIEYLWINKSNWYNRLIRDLYIKVWALLTNYYFSFWIGYSWFDECIWIFIYWFFLSTNLNLWPFFFLFVIQDVFIASHSLNNNWLFSACICKPKDFQLLYIQKSDE